MRKLVSIFMAAFILLAMPLNTLATEQLSLQLGIKHYENIF